MSAIREPFQFVLLFNKKGLREQIRGLEIFSKQNLFPAAMILPNTIAVNVLNWFSQPDTKIANSNFKKILEKMDKKSISNFKNTMQIFICPQFHLFQKHPQNCSNLFFKFASIPMNSIKLELGDIQPTLQSLGQFLFIVKISFSKNFGFK